MAPFGRPPYTAKKHKTNMDILNGGLWQRTVKNKEVNYKPLCTLNDGLGPLSADCKEGRDAPICFQ